MIDPIDIRITTLFLSKIMLNEYKDPGIIGHICISLFSLIISIAVHLGLQYIFKVIGLLFNKIIMFIINNLYQFNINEYLEQFFHSSRRNRKFSSIQRKNRNHK